MSVERADVVVVGGGVAGLTAAHSLRDRDVVVLEADDRIGGRVRCGRWDGQPYHLGAQYLAGAVSAKVFDELGVDRVPLAKDGQLFLRGQRRSGTAMSLMRGLGLGPIGLAEVWAVEREAGRVSGLINGLVNPHAPPGLVAGDAATLDQQSFSQAIADRRPAVQAFYATLIRSLTGKGPAELSALYAFAMLGSEGKRGVGGANHARGGMQEVLDGFARSLHGRIRTDAPVRAIEHSDGRVQVECDDVRIDAGACVVAVPAVEIARILPQMSDLRRSALEHVRYGRFLAVALFLREPVWEGGWAIACDLPVVSTLLNPAVLTGSGESRVLSSYASDDGAQRVWDLPDDAVVRRFVDEISQVFPRLRDVVLGAEVRRWHPGYPGWEPGHLALLSTLTVPDGPIAFCGDYLSIPSVDGAIVTGLRAASQVRAMVARPAR